MTKLKEKILQWINEQGEKKNIVIEDDTNLFDTGILDSFGIIALLAFMIEDLCIDIDIESIDANNFQTIEDICKLVNK